MIKKDSRVDKKDAGKSSKSKESTAKSNKKVVEKPKKKVTRIIIVKKKNRKKGEDKSSTSIEKETPEKSFKKGKVESSKPEVKEGGVVEPETEEKPTVKKSPYKKGETFRKGYYYKKEEKEKDIGYVKKKSEEKIEKKRVLPKEITITENVTVSDLAKKMNVKANEIIKTMLGMGEMVTINKVLDSDTATIVASEYGINVKVVSLYEETKIVDDEENRKSDYVVRPPVVTIMGHVDHGKTQLLDTIRKSNIIKKEAGGITQHIGAYKVKVNFKGKQEYITFVDTPGHEAFTAMRARGAQITDIVVLIIAADDGIMPQTIESINHAKEAKVPIIVAINKIDLPGVEKNIDKIKQDLTKYGIVSEEWGGETMVIPVSAKEGKNIDKLLEAILLQSELMELKANPKLRAKGTVVESRKDPTKGSTATILIHSGELHIGDPFVAGIYSGKVRSMYDDWGNTLQKAGPSTPVLITGIDGTPFAGDPFQVVESEKYSRMISQKRKELKKEDVVKSSKKITLFNVYEQIKKGKLKELKIVLKGDVDGSVNALKMNLEKLSNDEVQVKIIHSGTGEIIETDIMLASASNAIVIGFNVKYNKKVENLIKREGVAVRLYRIIYDLIDDVKKGLEGMLEPLVKEEGRGFLEVKEIFKVSKVGIVAGCIVNEGKAVNGDKARVIRNDEIIYDGKIESLKRFKEEVKEVLQGQECGIYLGPYFKDIKPGDIIESYIITKMKRTL